MKKIVIEKISKPINISRFKKSALSPEPLLRTRREFSKLARHVRASSHAVNVRLCYVCGGSKKQKEGEVYGIHYWRCRRCHHLFAARRLGAEGMNDYYRRNKNYSADYANPATYRYRLKEIAIPKVRFVKRWVRTSRRKWLDIGSGIGDMVVAAGLEGFEARGIEISRDSVEFAKKVFKVTLSSEKLRDVLRDEGPGSYDVISFFGVLEHIPDMREQTRLASRLLSKNGVLVIEVPNADSVSSFSDTLFSRQVTRHLYPPFHIMAFTRKSLTWLVNDFGLEPEAVWYFGLDFYNLLIHWGLQSKNFMQSPLANFLVENNNAFQTVIDRKRMSDEMLLVARKVI